jgi:hypothetical protein
MNQKQNSGSCRCVCRKLRVGRRICNDVTLVLIWELQRRASCRDSLSLEFHGSRVSQGCMSHPGTSSWVLLHRESRGDSTSRPWNFGDVEFPPGSKGIPVELSTDSAVSLFAQPRGSTTRKERAAFRWTKTTDEGRKRGLHRTPKWIFWAVNYSRMKATSPGLGKRGPWR